MPKKANNENSSFIPAHVLEQMKRVSGKEEEKLNKTFKNVGAFAKENIEDPLKKGIDQNVFVSESQKKAIENIAEEVAGVVINESEKQKKDIESLVEKEVKKRAEEDEVVRMHFANSVKKEEQDQELLNAAQAPGVVARRLENPIPAPESVAAGENKVNNSEKKEVQHEVISLETKYTYQTIHEDNAITFKSAQSPSSDPFPSVSMIAYIQDQILQAKRSFAPDSIRIDLSENMDPKLKHAYSMVCAANHVDCYVNDNKLIANAESDIKEIKEVRQQLLVDLNNRSESLQLNIKDNKIPHDCSLQLNEIKQNAESLKKDFSGDKDFNRELDAAALVRGATRMLTTIEAIENKAEQKNAAPPVAVVDPEVQQAPTRPRR